MNNHVKPTADELEASIKKTQEELEKETSEDNPPAPTPSEEAPKEPEDTHEDESTPSEEIPTPSEEAPKEPEDLKTKLKESAKEAIRLAEDEKKINDAFHEANNLTDPTIAELQVEYPYWEDMSDTEKKLAKDNLHNKRKLDLLSNAAEERRIVQVWDEKVQTHIDNPKTLIAFPGLEGKQDAFIVYATSKENRNTNLDHVVKSFLFEESLKKVKHTGKMFESGSGGEKVKEKVISDKLTVEEGQKLMNDNYDKYRAYLKAGKIANE